jgi:hypothetical protein
LANALNDMAHQLLDNEQYAAAEAHLQSSLKIKEKLIQERSMPAFEIAEYQKNLSIAKLGQGMEEEAVRLSQEAVAVLLEEDCDNGTYSLFRFFHGVCLVYQGLLSDALLVFEETQKMRIATFGYANAQTLSSTFAISFVHHWLGHYDTARYEQQKSLLRC